MKKVLLSALAIAMLSRAAYAENGKKRSKKKKAQTECCKKDCKKDPDCTKKPNCTPNPGCNQ